jgi:outer membrane protein assembly factor BamD (BamD/ComL family)
VLATKQEGKEDDARAAAERFIARYPHSLRCPVVESVLR